MKMIRPLSGTPPISQSFGPTNLTEEPPFAGFDHFHGGVDYAVPTGTPVLAPADGVVGELADTSWGFGTHIIIHHGLDVYTLLGHLSRTLVHSGQHVKQGEVVGYSGSTGNSTGPHLHWSLMTSYWYWIPPAALVY